MRLCGNEIRRLIAMSVRVAQSFERQGATALEDPELEGMVSQTWKMGMSK